MKFKSARENKTRDFAFDIKAVSDQGTFSGYASVFGEVDSYREIVVKGAFLKSLAARNQKERPIPVLWQHRSDEPIGAFTRMEEDAKGLYCEGQLLLDVQVGKEAHSRMRAKVVTGLSIGYDIVEYHHDEKNNLRYLTELDLVETSVVTFPACDGARIDATKKLLDGGKVPTVKQFHAKLRDLGFSQSQCETIISVGFRELVRGSETVPEAVKQDVAAMLAAASRPLFEPN